MADTAADAPASKHPSIEDELVEIHDGLVAEREPEAFMLPGYREKLQVEYRVLTEDEAEEISEKIAEQVRDGEIEESPVLIALIDSLLRSCVQFITQVDGEDVPLHVAKGEEKPIRWGDDRLKRIAGLSGVEKPTARQILRGVIGDRRLVEQHAREVSRWSERALQEVRRDFTPASPAIPE